MSFSANLNSNQVLNLINKNFESNNFRNVYTIKNTERDNVRVYEYHSNNCICNLFSKLICCKHKNSNLQFQAMTVLKRDENNFNSGINSFLNDIYERKISIKTIKGNEKSAIKAIVKFLKSYCLNLEKVKIIKQSKCFLKYNLDQTLKKIINTQKNKKYKLYSALSTSEEPENSLHKKRNSSNSLIADSLVEKTNDSASKYYEIYKVFSKKEYGLGKTIWEFIENFKKEYNYSDRDENINVNAS